MNDDADTGGEQMDFPESEPPTLVDDGALIVPDSWEETMFERGEFGPENAAGIEAKFKTGAHSIHLMPVVFERAGREERIEGATADSGMTKFGSEIEEKPDFGPETVFAVQLDYSTFTSQEMEFYAVCRNSGDALAVACWLMNVETTAELEEVVKIHNGTMMDSYIDSDEEALEDLRAQEATNCLLTGSPTQSREVMVPFMYAALFEGYPASHLDMPAVPHAVDGFEAVVSHTAWKNHDLSEGAFEGTVEREAAGRYVLPAGVVELVDGAPAERVRVKVL
jgi:hypothetical protein